MTGISLSDHIPPQDLQAEQACLGACLISAEAADIIIAMLSTKDFYREAHQLLFNAIADIHAAGSPVDIITVASELRRRKHLETCGGGEYLTALVAEVPTSAHAARYAEIVRRLAICRSALAIGNDLMQAAYDNPDDPASVIGDYTSKLQDLQERACQNGFPKPIGDYADRAIELIEERRNRKYAISTARWGIPELDRLTGGLEDAHYMILLGDTNAGKTSLAVQIVMSTALEIAKANRKKQKVLVFGMEESCWRWYLRMASWLGLFDTLDIKNLPTWKHKLAQDEGLEQRYSIALEAVRTLPIEYAEGAQSIASIESHCRRVAKKHEPVLVVLDWLQRIDKAMEGVATEEQAFREMSGRVVRLQESLGCPIIGSSQITAGPDGAPHAFGARAFDQTADLVVYINRARDPKDQTWSPECSLVALKNRDFASFGRFKVRTDFSTGRWSAIAPGESKEDEKPEPQRKRRYKNHDT